MKKAEMSLNVVIVAVIAIVVLIVLIIIFTGKTRLFSSTTSSCESRGGACMSGSACPSGYVEYRGTDCAKRAETGEASGPLCCGQVD